MFIDKACRVLLLFLTTPKLPIKSMNSSLNGKELIIYDDPTLKLILFNDIISLSVEKFRNIASVLTPVYLALNATHTPIPNHCVCCIYIPLQYSVWRLCVCCWILLL